MAIGWGEGAEVRAPMAITVMGGLMSSAVLTLVALPYVNLLIEYIAAWMKRMWQVSRSVKRRVEAAGAVEAVG